MTSKLNISFWTAGLALAALCWPATSAAAPASPRLPQLTQDVPGSLDIVSSGRGAARRFRLGFRSAAENHGTGPLAIRGHRPDRSTPRMTADQLIRMSDGSTSVVPAVGQLRFVRSHDHRHWHLLDFERYELRRAVDFRLVRPDRKTGFCLGDRYDADFFALEPFEPTRPPFTRSCGIGRPDLLSVGQGISVGYGDDYAPQLEGQFIDVTGLAGGRYVMTHRVNPRRLIRESRYDDNASSALLTLRWPRGASHRPTLAVLRRCPGTARCR